MGLSRGSRCGQATWTERMESPYLTPDVAGGGILPVRGDDDGARLGHAPGPGEQIVQPAESSRPVGRRG
ncbi:hypothetical protein GCM10027162_53090 [Streptomyces incanus]